MKYELIIVRYGELGLKAKATRKHFENYLVNNIKNALKTKQISFSIKRVWGRIYIYTDQINKSIEVLQKIFGITSISPAVKTVSNMESISKLAVKISKENITQENSFALRVKRTGKHSFSSQDVAVEVGNNILKIINSSVNLTCPDLELFIEIRNEHAYLFVEKIRCAGGFPLRTQGNILVFVDGLESILAAWYIMKRGCKTIFLNTDTSVSDVLYAFIDRWYADQDVVMTNTNKPIYNIINDIAFKRNCAAIVTGHSLYGASNNVLSDLKLLNEQITIPILHPLIAMEKEEIKKKCEEIGIQK